MTRTTLALLAGVITLAVPTGARSAQGDQLDSNMVALTFHKISREPLDLRAAAGLSEAVQRASSFDRPDALNAETARLDAALQSADASREFVVRVDDAISEYDHDRSEFSIELFKPGYSVPMSAFGERYQLVFSNAAAMRAIPMQTEQARIFDASLNTFGRRVVDEIHFRVIGAGDPSGAVTGAHVIRAEIAAARILDPSGRVLVTPVAVASNTAAGGASAPSGVNTSATTLDAAGLHVGVSVDDLEATLTRLYGPVAQAPAGRTAYPGLTTSLTVNDNGCWTVPGSAKRPVPGAVCVTALADKHDIVRSIRIERVFSYVDPEVFRAALVQRYGPVAGATNGGGYALGWGADVDPSLGYDASGPHSALTAHYENNDDFMSRGLNSLPQIRIVISLVDAGWARENPRS